MTYWLPTGLVALLVLVVPEAAGQGRGYGRPAILSRGTPRIGRGSGRPIRVRPYASVYGQFINDITRPATDEAGNFRPVDAAGILGRVGLMGSYSTERSASAVDGVVGYNHFTNNSYYTGLNVHLAASHSRQLTPRVAFYAGAAGISQDNVIPLRLNPVAGEVETNLTQSASQVFDARYRSGHALMGFTFQPTRRWVFAVSGGAYSTQYHSGSLASWRGFNAAGEANYYVTPRQAVGIDYSFQEYYYKGSFGEGRSQSFMPVWARKLSPKWDVRVGAGVYRLDYQRLETVKVDPIIAILTGQSSTLVATSGTVYGLAALARLAGTFSNSTAEFTYRRGTDPGNGVILNAESQSVTAGYTYTGLQDWNFGARLWVGRWKEPFNNKNSYAWGSFGVGAGRRISSFLHFNCEVVYVRSILTSANRTSLNRYYLLAGFSFSPGEIPLALF